MHDRASLDHNNNPFGLFLVRTPELPKMKVAKAKEDGPLEQRINLRFLVRLGKSAAECYDLLHSVYGKQSLSRSSIYKWFWRFSNGQATVWDRKNTGRPNTAMNERNLKRVRKLIKENDKQGKPCLSIRKVARSLGIDKETARKLMDVLKKPEEVAAKPGPCLPSIQPFSIDPIQPPRLSHDSSHTPEVEVQDTCIVVSFASDMPVDNQDLGGEESEDEIYIPEPPNPMPEQCVLPPISRLYFSRNTVNDLY